jgi:hypothetical protein
LTWRNFFGETFAAFEVMSLRARHPQSGGGGGGAVAGNAGEVQSLRDAIARLQRDNDSLEAKLRQSSRTVSSSSSVCGELFSLLFKSICIIVVLCAAVVCYQVIHHDEGVATTCDCPYQEEFVPISCDFPALDSTVDLLNEHIDLSSKTEKEIFESFEQRLETIQTLDSQIQRLIELVNQRHAELKKSKETLNGILSESKKKIERLVSSIPEQVSSIGSGSKSSILSFLTIWKKHDLSKLVGLTLTNWIIFSILSPRSSKIVMFLVSLLWLAFSVLALAWDYWTVGILSATNSGLQLFRMLF